MGNKKPSMTRRSMIRGLATAVGAASAGGVLLADDVTAKPAEPSGARAELPVTLLLNGVKRSGSFEARITLAEALRETWGLTGTKIGCDRGACGACTVLLDGVPVNACLTLVHDADGRHVTTIEGIGSPEALSPIQRAFLASDALQCGFCTPGTVMSCHALLAGNASPSPDEVRQAVSGNLCRCGTYLGVFAACSATEKSKVTRG